MKPPRGSPLKVIRVDQGFFAGFVVSCDHDDADGSHDDARLAGVRVSCDHRHGRPDWTLWSQGGRL